MKSLLPLPVCMIASLLVLAAKPCQAQQGSDSAVPMLRTTVRRVVVDVVVTDRAGKPVAGLKKEDFKLFEDNQPQQVLSFDALGFSPSMDYVPPKLAALSANTFVNLPATPEKGPLYVLLYDLVNVEKNEDQIFARKELVKFIQSKPEGTRFAIFMLSDGLHLVQGFTSDKNLLFAVIDPNRSHPHVPKIFLMGKNFGQDDPGTAILTMKYLANYLNGLPGRKNVLWLSGNFPLTLFPDPDDNPDYIAEVRQTLDLLARSQIAIYPVDVRGVSVENPHAAAGSTGGGGISSDSREHSTASGSNTPAPGSATAAGSISPGAGGIGYNTLISSYATADEIARITGGRAFYSTNNVRLALTQATEDGASYYTLSYSPSNRDFDSKLHNIRVELAEKGYTLAYRHAYYGLDPNAPSPSKGKESTVALPEPTPDRKRGDSLDANMEHGAPMAHDLVFAAHVEPIGEPMLGTPEEMAQLADQPAFFRTRRRNAAAKPLAPVKLQKYTIQYSIMARQLQPAGITAPLNLEIAAAAYDHDGKMLNGVVGLATREDSAAAAQRSYRAEQELLVPLDAGTLRVAVRDANTDRIGALEVKLPLQPEPQTAGAVRAVSTRP